MRIVFLLPILGSILGALIVFLTIASKASAPQEAAGYSLACAAAIVPYVLARAVVLMGEASASQCADRVVSAITGKPPER